MKNILAIFSNPFSHSNDENYLFGTLMDIDEFNTLLVRHASHMINYNILLKDCDTPFEVTELKDHKQNFIYVPSNTLKSFILKKMVFEVGDKYLIPGDYFSNVVEIDEEAGLFKTEYDGSKMLTPKWFPFTHALNYKGKVQNAVVKD